VYRNTTLATPAPKIQPAGLTASWPVWPVSPPPKWPILCRVER